jgi:hypothetical protein
LRERPDFPSPTFALAHERLPTSLSVSIEEAQKIAA